MRGYFEPIEELITVVNGYCSRQPEGYELLLFDCLWISGSTNLQLNEFEAGAKCFEQGFDILQQCVNKGCIRADDDRIAIASGLMGNGRMALNLFAEAENWYLRRQNMVGLQ